MRTPYVFHGCNECRTRNGDLANGLRELTRAKRTLRNARDETRDRYVKEAKAAAAWVKGARIKFEAHHAEVHPVPAVVLQPTDNDRAPSHRKPRLPAAADMAAMLRDGETLDDLAATYERTPAVIGRKITWAGFNSRTGQPRRDRWKHDADGIPIPITGWMFPPWVDQALCAQTDPEAFFPDKGGSTREAKAVCAVCPVRLQCLEWALDNNERYGIYGGLSERERRRLKKKAGRAS